MLARVGGIEGVRDARVDCAGRHLVVTVDAASGDATLAAIRATLGGHARELDDGDAAAERESLRLGEPWFAAAELLRLSYIEARLLAERLADGAAGPAGLAERDARHLAATCRRVLAARFEAVHAEGGRASPGWFFDEWPEIARAIADACAWLPAATRDAIGEALAGAFAKP